MRNNSDMENRNFSDYLSSDDSCYLEKPRYPRSISNAVVTRNRCRTKRKRQLVRKRMRPHSRRPTLSALEKRFRKRNVLIASEPELTNWADSWSDKLKNGDCDSPRANISAVDKNVHTGLPLAVESVSTNGPLKIEISFPEQHVDDSTSQPHTPASSGSCTLDPHKRARKFLYHLAPLLKVSLPSRVERKRAENLLDFRSGPARPGPRASICEKQWTKYGVPIYHCLSFIENGTTSYRPSLPGASSSAMLNADFYVQRLWRELQFHCRDRAALEDLDRRSSLARAFIDRISALEVFHSDKSAGTEFSVNLHAISSTLGPVCALLSEADRVQRCYSSEARLISEVVDWALPEVVSRLGCVRQWFSRYAILTRGLAQICAFLHHSPQTPCTAHHTVRPSERTATQSPDLLLSCPLLLDDSDPGKTDLFRQFLRSCWCMPPLIPSEQDNTDCYAPVLALTRLDRLTQRILAEIGGDRLSRLTPQPDCSLVHVKATQTPSHARTTPSLSMFTQTESRQSAPELSAMVNRPDTPVKCLTSILISPEKPVSSQPNAPSPSPMPWKFGDRGLSPSSTSPGRGTNFAEVRQGSGLSAYERSQSWWAQRFLRTHKTSSQVRSYASIVKRRSWCGHSSPLTEFNNSAAMAAEPTDRLPVNWEICSPVNSPSLVQSSTGSSSASPKTRSSHEHKADSSTSDSLSGLSASSSTSSVASLTSLFRLRCATRGSSASSQVSSSDSLLQADLREQRIITPHHNDDEGLKLGLPTLVPLWLCVASVTFYVTREAVSVKLEQFANRVSGATQINPISMSCLVNESRALLLCAIRITRTLRKNLLLASNLNSMVQPRSRSTCVVTYQSATTSSTDDPEQSPQPLIRSRCSTQHSWSSHLIEQVHQFLDNSHSTGSSKTSILQLLNAYVDGVIVLFLSECASSSASPSDLKRHVEEEWNFLQRLYRKLRVCLGGLQLRVFTLDTSTALRAQSVEGSLVKCIQRFIHFLSDQLGPMIESWVRSTVLASVSLNSNKAETGSAEVTTSPVAGNGFRSENTRASPQPLVTPAGGASELFQEMNEMWREMRLWLNCLLDISGVLCTDLDTSVFISLGIPIKNTSTMREEVDPPKSGIATDFSAPVCLGESRSKAFRKVVRHLRQNGYVLLQSWDQTPNDTQERSSFWDYGCIFIWSPLLQPHESVKKSQALVIGSSEARHLVRTHISSFVHRLIRQAVFRSRHTQHSDRALGPRKFQNIFSNQSCGTNVEHLLVCPNLSPTSWNGLVYNLRTTSGSSPSSVKYACACRLWFELNWMVMMCKSSFFPPKSSPSPKYAQTHVELFNLWLLAEHPYTAWNAFRDSSERIRQWLTVGSVHYRGPSSIVHSGINSSSLLRATSLIQLAPIQPDICQSVSMLRKSLCDLCAQLQGLLLVMESHLCLLDPVPVSPNEPPIATNRSSCSRSVSYAGRETHFLTTEAVQRAYSVVFGFHKILIRLLFSAPFLFPSDHHDCRHVTFIAMPLQTRLVHLGVQMLTNWANFVMSRYPRGRGRIPRWANDACHFAYQLCQPRSVNFLQAKKISSLESILNHLIPYLIGEAGPQTGTHSPVLSTPSASQLADPAFARCLSDLPTRTNPPVGRPRRVHSSHAQGKHLPATSRIGSKLPELRGSRNRELALSNVDRTRDIHLRSRGLIGHPIVRTNESHTRSANHCPPTLADKVDCGKRHFPYTWNRGRLIGRGVTGKVFQAFNLQTQEMMAVKEVISDYDWELQSPPTDVQQRRRYDEARERLHSFRRECDLLASLSHPALVRFLGADEQTPNVLRLFTELCTAGTLADIAKERPSEVLIRRYAHDLARAVVYLHDRGIVHRDIKPSNVFLVGPSLLSGSSESASAFRHSRAPSHSAHQLGPYQSLLKLGDFSHSLRLHSFSGTARGTAGTVCYMAPEVCRDLDSGYGRPCDIWSYCCVLLELLTGRPPWFGVVDMYAIFFKLCHGQTPMLPSVYPDDFHSPSVNRRSIGIEFNHPGSGPNSSSNGVGYASAEAVNLLTAGIVADPAQRPTASQLFEFDFIHCPINFDRRPEC